MYEQCGIVAVADLKQEADVSPFAVEMLKGVWHRGQLGAGIAAYRDGYRGVLKGNGDIGEVLQRGKLPQGWAAVAHARYATSGSRSEENAQPFVSNHLTFCFNGNIANHVEACQELAGRGVPVTRDVDTEVVLQLMLEKIRSDVSTDMRMVMQSLEGQLDGAFNIAAMRNAGEIYLYRDARGILPLSYAVIDDRFVAAASENSAIQRVFPDAETHDLESGHLLSIANGNWSVDKVMNPQRAHCFFEWVYFAHVLSTLDGVATHAVREECGRYLACQDAGQIRDGIVIPVPHSAHSAAQGYANESGLPLIEAIIRQTEGRTFIVGTQEERMEKARMKYGLLKDKLDGQSIVLVEDSVVRGTTMRVLVDRLRREGGVQGVHLRVACPPIVAPCFYGKDFSTIPELLAHKHIQRTVPTGILSQEALDTIAKELHLDSIRYLPAEAVPKVLGKDRTDLCMACVTGEYPTPKGKELYQLAVKKLVES